MIAARCHIVRMKVVAAIAAGAVIASACTSSSSGVQSERADQSTVSEPGDVQADDVQGNTGTLEWSSCSDAGDTAVSLECATLKAPLDYDDPNGKQINIAIARLAAVGPAADRVGSLVFNPGGPGGSGIDSLGFIPLTMSPEILQRFDLVSFDPRGVGASTALTCDNDLDDQVTLLAGGDDIGWQELVDNTAAQLDTCTAETNALAPHVGTNNAARDLDLLRAALGDDGLSYVGYSYGTRLGATYAELFPDNVRALVLDAAVKPTRDAAELDREQGAGFDRALENFAAACDADTDCVLQEIGPTLEVIDALEIEIAEVGSFPTEDPDRVLTPGELNLGVAAALYSKESWPFLASALFKAAIEQDGSLLQVLGDSLVGRQSDGTYDNSQVANSFINCADDGARPNADEQRILAMEAADMSTYFADLLRASTGCLGMEAATDPLVIGPAAGSAPIVVIGNTGDPATPYEWSRELANSLDAAVLYTVEAEGHTAYGIIECVQADIDAYLIGLTVPVRGSTCSDNTDADFFIPEGDGEIDQLIAFFDCARDAGAGLPDISVADILSDPTLEKVLDSIDITDPAVVMAFGVCQEFIPGL